MNRMDILARMVGRIVHDQDVDLANAVMSALDQACDDDGTELRALVKAEKSALLAEVDAAIANAPAQLEALKAERATVDKVRTTKKRKGPSS